MNQTNLIDDLTLVAVPVWWQSPWFLGLVLVAVGAMGWWMWRWLTRPRPVLMPPYAGAYPPLPADDALRRLHALRARAPKMKDYDLAIEASEILRAFVESRHQLPIRYQTTREFLDAAAANPDISAPQRSTLGQFLGFCDLAKFARRPATVMEMVQTVDTAIRFVEEVSGDKARGGVQ